MFLNRPLYPQDLARFNEGFVFYWDVFCELSPELPAMVEKSATDPIVIAEFTRHGIQENAHRFVIIKSLTFLIYVLGDENANNVIGDNLSSTLCAVFPIVIDPQYLSPEGPLANCNIAATLISSILIRRSRECLIDPKTYIQNTLMNLNLPGYLFKVLDDFLKREMKRLDPVNTMH
jgi:hypothetical protein